MGAHVVDDHAILHAPALACRVAALQAEHHSRGGAAGAADIATGGLVEDAALQAVTDHIVEYGDAADAVGLDLADIALVRLGAAVDGGAHGPAFAVEDGIGVDAMDRHFHLLHGLQVMEAHQVEAEAVQMELLHPVGGGLHHELAEHIPLGGRIVAAAAGGGVGAGGGISVIIVGNDLIEGGIAVIGVVIDHVHDHADAGLMEGRHHLLILVDPDLTMVGVRGIAALGHIVVLGIVAPVEGGIGIGFVHGGIVIDRQQMHMGDAQALQIVDAYALAVFVHQARFREGQVLAGIFGALDGIGEVTDMDLPDDGFVIMVDGVFQRIGVPAFGIRQAQVHHHASVAVDAGGSGIGVHRLLGAHGGGDGIGIVGAVTAGRGMAPDALLAAGHLDLLIGIHAVAGGEEVQDHVGSGRCPDLKCGAVARDHRAKVGALIVIVLGEPFGVENLHRDHGALAVAHDLDPVGSGDIQRLRQLDIAGGGFLALGGEAQDLHGLVSPIHLDIGSRQRGLGSDPVEELIFIRHGGDGDLLGLVQGQAAIVALIEGGVAGLQVDMGLLALDGGEAVGLIVLGSGAPGASAGVGAVTADDEAQLLNALGDIDDGLGTVFALVEDIALAGHIAPPGPNVAIFIGAVPGPVEGHLVIALGDGLGVFLHRRRSGLLRGGRSGLRGRRGGLHGSRRGAGRQQHGGEQQ